MLTSGSKGQGKPPARNYAGGDGIDSGLLEAIRGFDTCSIANAIEQFGVRLRNEGYTQPGLHCVTGGYPCLVGYAATCQVRSPVRSECRPQKYMAPAPQA